MNIKIEKYFNRYRCFVLVEDSLEPYCKDFTDDDFYELSKLKEIRCVLDGEFDNLINSIYNRGFTDISFGSKCKIFIDKPNKNKSEETLKNEFRMKIIKGE